MTPEPFGRRQSRSRQARRSHMVDGLLTGNALAGEGLVRGNGTQSPPIGVGTTVSSTNDGLAQSVTRIEESVQGEAVPRS